MHSDNRLLFDSTLPILVRTRISLSTDKKTRESRSATVNSSSYSRLCEGTETITENLGWTDRWGGGGGRPRRRNVPVNKCTKKLGPILDIKKDKEARLESDAYISKSRPIFTAKR